MNNLQHAIILERLDIKSEAADPNEDFLISMSIAGNADYLVTGDRRAGLLQKRNIGRTRILTPSAFCSEALP